MSKQMDDAIGRAGKTHVKKKSQLLDIWKRLKKNRLAVVGLVILVILLGAMIFADQIVSYDVAIKQDLVNKLQGPSTKHIMGTDSFGRDIFARVVHGSRISLSIGFISVALSLLIGGTIGSLAGFYGGKIDSILMRFMDMFLAMPSMLLAICIVSVLGPGMVNLVMAISLASIPRFAVIVRSSVLTIKSSEFVEAARSAGAGTFRIIVHHILPNCMGPIIVQATLSMGGVILTASSLSFIGLGVMPPKPEWGAILTEGKEFIRESPYLVLFPGLAIMISVLALNFLGDGLRDALDPRLK